MAQNVESHAAPVPPYVLDHGDPAGLFTRLQRVGIHLELLQREAMRGLDLNFGDFVILATLRKEPPPHVLPVTRIAEYVLRPMGSISQALDRVERAGWVARAHDPDDGRKVIVTLTEAGEAIADRSLLAYDAVRERIFDQLDPIGFEAVDQGVTALLDVLDADYRRRTDAGQSAVDNPA